MSMQSLFDESVGIALSKQRDLGEKIGSAPWQFDMGAGTLTFTEGGRRLVSSVQILGTQSDKSQTFLWAWDNAKSAIPAGLLRAAQDLRGYGEQNKIPELTTGSFSVDTWDGHEVAMIASALFGVPGYYRAPFAGGAMFVLLTSPELAPAKLSRPLLRFVTIVPELDFSRISEPNRAIGVFARRLGLKIVSADPLEAVSDEGSATVRFDAQGRFAGLEADLFDAPAGPSPESIATLFGVDHEE